MLSTDLETMALNLPGTQESSHFGKRDFRVGEKIFMSLPEAGRAVCKLTPGQQQMLLETEPGLCAAVPGGWGLKGWTSVYFEGAEHEVVARILRTAWRNVAPKSLAKDLLDA
ncbi:MmcQ/YjbR family DNA-binding protein [Pararhizobium sp.]|uniref:MmcQ/YjbR family DNA-binding protein n=1 Tax=Pararhizobium sp. TaxID=1977563 RepID=UPI002720C8A5|nr:MmcQ/YjbR family DNA-binding protein [Pararhizobium sp.]MDO9417336.1 MmcQ/YjbR family DNA-binding protein [Pararhizobium sp.]